MARTKNFNQEEILDKAVELFWINGYNATSANDLVENLGLSRSSLYDTFGDKRTLFVKSLQRYRSKIVNNMLFLVEHSTDIKKTIEEVFKLVIEQDIHSKISKGCFMVNSAIELSACDEEIALIVMANQTDIVSTFEIAILKGQNLGQITTNFNANHLANFLYNSISGIRVAIKYNQNLDAINDIVKINLAILS
ncbi:TetR/AcrR family transcriptional regulator [Flavobacterium soyangense]|uniref:TetR/AcrR family transcriptional regulator n=1 Tax=Flavobacterium soyangense TaxID=2023265 RepID=A0A930UDP8_9FLAO|nr:TetR/AcrR family transcriptional regulator [Flavobacterium soyangense]MBF2709436.1 TetR/AcrR family transcriptional regulator [Flavobacterium soyangense]